MFQKFYLVVSIVVNKFKLINIVSVLLLLITLNVEKNLKKCFTLVAT